jgi:hypothetical protein
MDDMPELGLSEDVFAEAPEAAAPDEPLAEDTIAGEPTESEAGQAAAQEAFGTPSEDAPAPPPEPDETD